MVLILAVESCLSWNGAMHLVQARPLMHLENYRKIRFGLALQ